VQPDLPDPITVNVDTSFSKGNSFADWLVTVGASTTRGQFPLVQGQHSVDATFGSTRRWVYTTSPSSTQYLTFNTPVEAKADNQCGRVVFTDVHVSLGNGDSSHPGAPGFPAGCVTTTMSAQEKALEFTFFDLSSCVQLETGTPTIPPIPVPGTAPTPPPASTPAPPAPPPPPPPPPPPNPG
jgi:hypothetical protein